MKLDKATRDAMDRVADYNRSPTWSEMVAVYDSTGKSTDQEVKDMYLDDCETLALAYNTLYDMYTRLVASAKARS